MRTEYAPPITLDNGRAELDTIPDSDGDLELIATLEDVHVAYLRPADQIVLRDLLNRLHPMELRTVTTVEELDALPFESVIMDAHKRVFHRWLLAGWQSAGPTLGTSIALPATVLHEPTA